MPSIGIRDFDLNQTTLTGRRKPDVELDALRPLFKVDKQTKQRTDVREGHVADIVVRNRIQSVKLPEECITEETEKQIHDALAENKVVTVNFGTPSSTLRGKCYALINQNGQLLSGVTCTATELNIVSITDPETDDLDDLDIDI